jgi:FkbM family methyltransferase
MAKPGVVECGDLNVLVSAKHGRMLVNRNDIYIGRSIQELGEFSEGEVELLRQVVRPGAIVVEAGANIGSHTVPLSKFVGPTGHVYAIEPQRIVFQLLCANLALNSLTNVTALWAAVGDQVGQLFVPVIDYSQANNFGGLGLESRTSGEQVPVVMVDRLGLPRLDLLKADVEGMEQAVLMGARETIERCHPLLYVESDRQDKATALLDTIKGLGYSVYSHAPRLFAENNFFGETNNPFGNIVSLNLFAVHESVAANIQGLKQL